MAKKILLVEDDAIIALSEAQILKKHAYEVVIAHSGEKALETLDREPGISLVLMDIDLGRSLDGPETAELILITRDLPIVFLTSHNEKEYVDRVKKITSYGYVLKNSGEFVLLESINMAYTLFEAHQNVKNNVRKLREAENRSEKHRRFLKTALESVPVAILTVDASSHVVEWSREAEQLFGYTAEETKGRLVDDLITLPEREERAEARDISERVQNGEDIGTHELVRYRKDGSPVHVLLSVGLIKEYGETIGAVASYKEIYPAASGRESIKRAESTISEEARLRTSEERYRSLFHETPLGAFQYNREGGITECNHNFVKIIGSSREALIGLNMLKALKDRELIDQIKRSLSEGEGYYEGIYTSVTADKETPVRVFLKGLRQERGEISTGIGLVEDITERKKISDELNLEKHYFQSLMDAIHDTVYFKDEEHRFLRVNRAKAGEVNLTPEEMIGLTDFDFFPREIAERSRKDDEEVLRSGEALIHKEEEIITNSIRKTVVVSKFPLNDEKGKPIGTMGISMDVSRLKEVEKNLRRALEEKDFLMRELNHRIKNNLAIITSLLRLKNMNLEGDTDLSDVILQIDAIRLVHEKLHRREEIGSIALQEYFGDLLDTIFSSFYGREVSRIVEVEEFELDTRATISLGLIVNEIAINAIKHGFIDGDEAIFSLNLRKTDEGRAYELVMSNTGKPFPEDIDIHHSGSLGLELISTLVTQLNGSIELRKSPYPVFTLRVPLHHKEENK